MCFAVYPSYCIHSLLFVICKQFGIRWQTSQLPAGYIHEPVGIKITTVTKDYVVTFIGKSCRELAKEVNGNNR
jgi:hypothetical protein